MRYVMNEHQITEHLQGIKNYLDSETIVDFFKFQLNALVEFCTAEGLEIRQLKYNLPDRSRWEKASFLGWEPVDLRAKAHIIILSRDKSVELHIVKDGVSNKAYIEIPEYKVTTDNLSEFNKSFSIDLFAFSNLLTNLVFECYELRSSGKIVKNHTDIEIIDGDIVINFTPIFKEELKG